VAQQTFTIPQNLAAFKSSVYTYANGFDTCLCLDNNQNQNACGYSSYDMVAGMGAKATLRLDCEYGAFERLKQFQAEHNSWLLGYLGYDLKNGVEKLTSNRVDKLGFAPLYFFVPQIVVLVTTNSVEIIADNPADVYHTILNTKQEAEITTPKVQFIPRVGRDEYIEKVEKVRQHIAEGDVYEMNLCMEFYAQNAQINFLQIHLQLLKISPVPFAAYGKFGNGHYAMCASPERFIKKEGDKLISQPIKGTAKRGQNPADDEALKYNLRNSEKEMAENVMIVDLVRNDLARSAVAGSVRVEELFGIYSFPQVHQMISTITAQLQPGQHWADAIAKAFPMGSMTGAPKVMAMQLIEQYEESKRGLFSGAMGYITPNGDFDFNVVIRSLLYNAQNKYLSYHVGGAITYDSVAQEEFDECMVKALAINSLWGGKI
jgi:para-aminobenzoate synthetase component I